MENQVKINLVYGNHKYNLKIDKNVDYETFILETFCCITGITFDGNNASKEFINSKFSDNFFITWISKLVTIKNWNEIRDLLEEDDTLFISLKLKGGFLLPPPLIILAIFALLIPLAKPLSIIVQTVVAFFDILGSVIDLIDLVIDMVPLIFDPARLIDDILFAVTFGINKMFSVTSESAGGMASSPEDDSEGSGPFDLNKETKTKCIDPTFTTILLLILCPPLAILLKLGFLAGFVSSIICGVLCVKLYYFPGLLFAILHVLC